MDDDSDTVTDVAPDLSPTSESRSGYKQAKTETGEVAERVRYTLVRVRDWLENTNSWAVTVPGISVVQAEIDQIKAEVIIALSI